MGGCVGAGGASRLRIWAGATPRSGQAPRRSSRCGVPVPPAWKRCRGERRCPSDRAPSGAAGPRRRSGRVDRDCPRESEFRGLRRARPAPCAGRRRSEERRVGKECGSTCRSRGAPDQEKKKTETKTSRRKNKKRETNERSIRRNEQKRKTQQ